MVEGHRLNDRCAAGAPSVGKPLLNYPVGNCIHAAEAGLSFSYFTSSFAVTAKHHTPQLIIIFQDINRLVAKLPPPFIETGFAAGLMLMGRS